MDTYDVKQIIKIQKSFRGYISRAKRLPNSIYNIHNYLMNTNIKLNNENDDGRVNSSNCEKIILANLLNGFPYRVKPAPIRKWYDFLLYDYKYGWLPVNIKISKMMTNDNVGNLSICVQAFTDHKLDVKKSCYNNKASKILTDKLSKNEINKINKKDYYFIVINKSNTKDIISNSLKGIKVYTPNINNLPFQVCWRKNRNFVYQNIRDIIHKFIILYNVKLSWSEQFLHDMRQLNLKI